MAAKLTATEVKSMIQATAQFATAVMQAPDILAAVEESAKHNKELDKERRSLEGAIEELKRLEIEFQGRTNQARKDFHAYQDLVEVTKGEIEASFKPLRDEQEKIKDEIAALEEERKRQNVDKNNEFLSWEKKIADSRKRYEDFKNSI